jgi:hypothetical protein
VASRHRAVTLCHEAGFEPEIRFESADVLLHVRMVEQKPSGRPRVRSRLGGAPANSAPYRPGPWRTTRRILPLCRSGASSKPAIVAFRKALRKAAHTVSSHRISGPVTGVGGN